MKPTAADYTTLITQLDNLLQQGQLAGLIDHWLATSATGTLRTVATLLNKRGIEHFNHSNLSGALTCFTLALRAMPADAAALNNVATCLREQGRLADSSALYRKALELQPDFVAAHSNLLMNMHYQAGVTPAQLLDAHREWDRRHAQPLQPGFERPRPQGGPDKILRVGLVSGDLGDHPVGIFLVRYLENIDPRQVQFIAYAGGQRQGPLAERIRAAASAWHDIAELDDAALAAKVAADDIDIVIDLCGHTADSRLGVFARRPAPLQISWLGYPGDTGLAAIDYVIGDPFVLPLSLQPHCVARIAQLPDCFVCFDPPAAAPPVNPLPATQPGVVTFGCFSNPAKCGAEVISLWAEILRRLPQSRLLLKYKGFGDARCQQDFIAQFVALSITPDRLTFAGASPPADMFAAMQNVDLALDPFPFSGGLMTCLTLWMGVPVLTLPMETFASRQGLSFLTAIGIADTLATSRQDYVEKAVALAHDLPRLASIRQRLRPALAASRLCDGRQAALALQNLLRQVWRTACG